MSRARRVWGGAALAFTSVVSLIGVLACRAGDSAAAPAAATAPPPPSPAVPSPAAPAPPPAVEKAAPAATTPTGPLAQKSCPPGAVWLEGGSFKSKRGAQVTVAGFCLDASEVTVAEWKKCVAAGKCDEPDREAGEACNWGTSDPAGFKRTAHPINCIDATQADTYCKVQGKRLPSADEFEWAQRGGERGTAFPWGADRLPRRVCSRANKNPDFQRAPTTCPVGSCPEGDSPEKVHDLSGNVQEWTATAPKPGRRLVCGGSTSCAAGSVNQVGNALAAGFCLEQDAAAKFEGVGFRCAR